MRVVTWQAAKHKYNLHLPPPPRLSTSSYDCWLPCVCQMPLEYVRPETWCGVSWLTHNWSNIFTTCSSTNNLILRQRRAPADVTDWDHCDQSWWRKLRINSSIVSNNNTGAGAWWGTYQDRGGKKNRINLSLCHRKHSEHTLVRLGLAESDSWNTNPGKLQLGSLTGDWRTKPGAKQSNYQHFTLRAAGPVWQGNCSRSHSYFVSYQYYYYYYCRQLNYYCRPACCLP